MLVGSIVSQFAEGVGLIAATIAVAGFLAHVPRALAGRSDRALREATVVGGLVGFGLAALVIVLSVLVSKLEL